MEFKFRNVNDAFVGLVSAFNHDEYTTPDGRSLYRNFLQHRPSRNGDVLVIDEPVMITYSHPRERVLLNPARDANPFALLYEALWMLAGRNDVAPLAYYTKQFTEYSDDGKTLNGSYGGRWRHAGPVPVGYKHEQSIDQLDLIVNHLKADPNSRRAVLQMWNVEGDLLKIGQRCPTCQGDGHHPMANYPRTDNTIKDAPCPECKGRKSLASKDVCCNLSVLFSLRRDDTLQTTDSTGRRRRGIDTLDMTVFNRSNDLVWGLLGANYVTFSLLQEYMAARLGAEVGRYHHFTNNLHVYTGTNGGKTARWDPEAWLAADRTEYSEPSSGYTTVPLVTDPAVFEKDLPLFVDRNSGSRDTYSPVAWREPFLNDVAQPMMTAFRAHKEKWGGGAMMWAEQIKADDWRVAATEWLQRRVDRANQR